MRTYYINTYPDYIAHHGVLGMKWGVRRYQNADGTLTAEGKARYGDDISKVKASHLSRQMYNYSTFGKGQRSKAKKAFEKELSGTKESKSFVSSTKSLKKIQDQEDFSEARVKAEEKALKKYHSAMSDYDTKRKEIGKKYVESLSSEYLKGMGYKDTKKSRDYISKLFEEYSYYNI